MDLLKTGFRINTLSTMKEMMNDPTREHLLKAIQKMVNLTAILLILVVLSPIYFSNKEKFNAAFADLVDWNRPTFDKSGEPNTKGRKELVLGVSGY
jgi:hypothetical protein